MRVFVVVLVAVLAAGGSRRAVADEPPKTSTERIDRARESALDGKYQRQLPRYETFDPSELLGDENGHRVTGTGLGGGSGRAVQGGVSGGPGSGVKPGPGSDASVGSGSAGSASVGSGSANVGSGGGGVGSAATGSGAGSGSNSTAGMHPTHRRYYRDSSGNIHEVPDDPRDRADHRYVDARDHDGGDPGVGSVMRFLLWGMVIVIIGLVIFWIVSEVAKYDGEPELPPSESQIAMKAAVDAIIDRPLGDADELAQQGNYADAIHTLLLRTLQELARSAAVRIAPANTSREILARVPLLADAREALADLITAVELTHFGDDPANIDDYQRCVAQFHRFASAFRGGMGAQPAQGGGTSVHKPVAV